MLKEFKEFALKGNVMDLAIGVIIGGAFQSIVNSLVNDIIMPIINSMTGKMDFSEMTFNIGNSVVKYGSFISAVVLSRSGGVVTFAIITVEPLFLAVILLTSFWSFAICFV